MKVHNILGVLVVLLILSISMSGYAQVQEKNLVGWWLFNDGTEETGNWGDIILRGATIKDGQMVCTRNNWANSIEYDGPDITDITLASWVALNDLGHTHGSALTLDRTDVDQFVAIVYAERQQRQWMPGSSHFRRTEDFPNVVNEDKEGEMTLITITYRLDGGQYEITGYRNDKSMGSFKKGDSRTWTSANAEAIWGARHSGGVANRVSESITADIDESRIYNVALTHDEVKQMYNGDLPVEPRGKLATRWAKIKR
ncbi:hypothetical protein C6501_12940 [Candidatus Poribacteria bacterium]|nr:MAG: hypothetical protein C6501_12940 [Candidatus Poribacteria bacterium]